MHRKFRSLVGNPTEQQVFRSRVDEHLENGVSMVAEELGLPPRTDNTTFALESGVYEYSLPSDVLRVNDVYWNDLPLTFSDLDTWRTRSIHYRGATSSTPAEVAIDGRALFVYPPPDASAITTDPVLTVRAQMASYGVTDSGVPGFSDTDVLLSIYQGALEFMAFNNMGGRFDTSIKAASAFVNDGLTRAKQRYAQMLQDHNPGYSVFSGRTGPAR